MAEEFVFDSKRIRLACADVREKNNAMAATVRAAQEQIAQLRAWQGEAGSTTCKRFQKLSGGSDAIRKEIETYAAYLERAVRDYGATEQKIRDEGANSGSSFE